MVDVVDRKSLVPDSCARLNPTADKISDWKTKLLNTGSSWQQECLSVERLECDLIHPCKSALIGRGITH